MDGLYCAELFAEEDGTIPATFQVPSSYLSL
jgi:hypothetical protein